MNLANLKDVVAAYLGVTTGDLTVGSTDLFLVAANNARKNAERLHNFEMARCTAKLDIDGVEGGDLRDADIEPLGNFAGIKEIVALSGLRDDGSFAPFDFTRSDIEIERERDLANRGWPFSPSWRYPSDAEYLNRGGMATIVLRSGSLFVFPRAATAVSSQPLTVYIEAYGWLPDYEASDVEDTEADPQDFLLEHGFDYLQWSVIIELNYRLQKFVPRQEGNVGVPEAQRRDAWQNLLLWDSYASDAHIVV